MDVDKSFLREGDVVEVGGFTPKAERPQVASTILLG